MAEENFINLLPDLYFLGDIMHQLTELVVKNLKRRLGESYPCYERMLNHSFQKTPPPFGQAWFGREYFKFARDKEWFANSLVANSALEGYGSQQIWKFSNRMHDSEHINSVRQHSLDESRHSTMFISMLNLTFPGISIDPATQQRITNQQPKFSPSNLPEDNRLPPTQCLSEDQTLNELVQVHITEIRALVLQYLLRSVIQFYAPPENRKRMSMFTSSLIRDETAHIDYTAKIFESAAKSGKKELMMELFESRVRDFNDLTLIEFERDRQMAI